MPSTCQDAGWREPDGNVVRLAETVKQLAGVVETAIAGVAREREHRVAAELACAAAQEARIAAEETIRSEYEYRVRLEARLAEWEVPPPCDCGRDGYEVWCRCGKRLK